MLLRIMKHEWRTLRADRTLWLLTILFALIVGYGVYNGASWVRFQRETIDAALKDEAKKRDELNLQLAALAEREDKELSPFADPRNPNAAGLAHGQRYAVMPPAPLAAFSVGQSDLLPYYFKVSTRSKQAFVNNDEIENPHNLLTGRFDLSFVVIYLLPLLILALGYNLISAEREQGTLAMLLSQPIALHTVVIGKTLLRAGVVLALAVGFALLGAFSSGINFTADGVAARLVLWVMVVVAYALFWFVLAIGVNALNQSSATNAVILASLWLLFVIIVPSLVGVAVTTLHPVPSRVELINAVRDASTAATTDGSRLLAKYYEDHPELAGGVPDPTDFAARRYAVQEEVDRRVAPILARYDGQLTRQQALVKSYRLLSPAIITQEALNDLSGTGASRYRRFLTLVDDYHRTWQAYFIPKVYQKATFTVAGYDAAPRFVWDEEAIGDVAKRTLGGIAGLVALTLLIGCAGLAALRRFATVG